MFGQFISRPFFSITEHKDVPIPSSDGCPENTRGCEEFSCPRTCYCEDHCSWERCTLSEPPQKCLYGTNAEWKWDLRWWSAKYIGQYKMIYIKINARSVDNIYIRQRRRSNLNSIIIIQEKQIQLRKQNHH